METVFEIALDDVTLARVMEVADLSHVDPCTLIAAIIHDVMEDDARAHGDDQNANPLH